MAVPFNDVTALIDEIGGYGSRADFSETTVRPLTFKEVSSDSKYIGQIQRIQEDLWQYGKSDMRSIIDKIRPIGGKLHGRKQRGFIMGAIAHDDTPDSELVGFFIGEHVADEIMNGCLLGVSANYQGNGLGKRLFHASMDYSRNEGCYVLSFPYDVSNIAAARLYIENGGAMLTQYYPNLYGTDGNGNRGIVEIPLDNERTRMFIEGNKDSRLEMEYDKVYSDVVRLDDHRPIPDNTNELLIKVPSQTNEFEEYFEEATKNGFAATRVIELDGRYHYYLENCTNLSDKATTLYKRGAEQDKKMAFAYIDLAMYLDPENERVVKYFEKLQDAVREIETKPIAPVCRGTGIEKGDVGTFRYKDIGGIGLEPTVQRTAEEVRLSEELAKLEHTAKVSGKRKLMNTEEYFTEHRYA